MLIVQREAMKIQKKSPVCMNIGIITWAWD